MPKPGIGGANQKKKKKRTSLLINYQHLFNQLSQAQLR
jgi:hypothetical protein